MRKSLFVLGAVLALAATAGLFRSPGGPTAPASASNDVVAGKLVDMVILQRGIITKGKPYADALALLKDCRTETLSVEKDYSTDGKVVIELCDCPNKKFRIVTGMDKSAGQLVVRSLFE